MLATVKLLLASDNNNKKTKMASLGIGPWKWSLGNS